MTHTIAGKSDQCDGVVLQLDGASGGKARAVG